MTTGQFINASTGEITERDLTEDELANLVQIANEHGDILPIQLIGETVKE